MPTLIKSYYDLLCGSPGTKRTANLAKHGVDFADVESWEWDAALVRADMPGLTAEQRLVGFMPHNRRIYVVVFVIRRSLRVIGARKASRQEAQRYADEV